ncbi:MAG TPA: DUF4436 family protein [Nakamurella sp.]
MTAMPHDGRRPRSGARARRWVLVAGVTAFVALYAGLAIAYLANGSQSVDAGDIGPPDGGVAVLVAARGINAATPEMDVDVEVLLSDSLLNDDGNPKEQLTLTLEPTLDDADVIWPTDRPVQIRSEKVSFDGDIQDWPLDRYTSQLFAAAWVGTGADFRSVDTALYFQGSVFQGLGPGLAPVHRRSRSHGGRAAGGAVSSAPSRSCSSGSRWSSC